MRHWVNFGLLFSFTTLLVSGVLAFVQPFSLVTTRVHIVFGLLTSLLVGLHLVSRTRYFANHFSGKGRSLSRKGLATIVLSWIGLLVLTMVGGGVVQAVIAQGYESRNRQAIVRSSPMSGFVDQEERRFVARQPRAADDASVALMVRLKEEYEGVAMAVWAETTAGTLIETLYLEDSLAYSEHVEWGGGGAVPRSQVLPIWRHRYTMVSGVDPKGEVDAYSAATSTHSFSLDSYLDLEEAKEFVICVEVNLPGDVSGGFQDPLIGQPSMLYTAYVDLTAAGYSVLELTGHGGAGADGTIQYDLESLDLDQSPVDLLLLKAEAMGDGSLK